jgi:hypothetical protein
MHGSRYKSWANEGSNLPAGYNDNGELNLEFTGIAKDIDHKKKEVEGVDYPSKSEIEWAKSEINNLIGRRKNGEEISDYLLKLGNLRTIACGRYEYK